MQSTDMAHMLGGVSCFSMQHEWCVQAMGRKPPVDFPVDSGMMPGVKKRVKLAIRLDNASRSGTKKRAEATWRANAAKELDIDLSDEDEGEEGGAIARAKSQVAGMQQVGSNMDACDASLSHACTLTRTHLQAPLHHMGACARAHPCLFMPAHVRTYT